MLLAKAVYLSQATSSPIGVKIFVLCQTQVQILIFLTFRICFSCQKYISDSLVSCASCGSHSLPHVHFNDIENPPSLCLWNPPKASKVTQSSWPKIMTSNSLPWKQHVPASVHNTTMHQRSFQHWNQVTFEAFQDFRDASCAWHLPN